MIIAYALGSLVGLGMLYMCLRGAIYVPTSDAQISRMLRAARIQPGERVADLGSGDGRLLLAFAQAGAQASGYEIVPILVFLSRRRLKNANVHARVLWRDFWHEDLSQFDVLTVYGAPHIMERLEEKCQRELRPGARVLANAFAFPTWEPEYAEDNLFVYRK